MDSLEQLGFDSFFQGQRARLERQDLVPARIAAEHRGGFEVWSEAGSGFVRLSGRLRGSGTIAAAVGDWVGLQGAPDSNGAGVIEHIFQRRTVFTRGAAGRATCSQVVAANVDCVFIVCGLDEDFNLHRIERYLARIWASGATPAVVLNKADVCNDVPALVRDVERHAVGVPIHVTSAIAGQGIDSIARSVAPGMTVAFVGSSGAGKSTLVNALVGEAVMATGEIRAADGRGRHTTTHRQLVLLPAGGLLLDTPGMRELQLVDDEGLDHVFQDIDAFADQCRFRDCSHAHEPGCAVKEAVQNGSLDADRLDHYHQLQREAHAYERRHDEHARRQSERVWGQLHAEVARLRKWKEGG